MISTVVRSTMKISLSAVAVLACGVIPAAEAEHPDFTGVWVGSRGAGRVSGFGGAGAELPLTEEGRRRMAEYNALLGPERANPAAYCVDYGTPMMMQLPGSYPIEFIQKPDQLTIIYEVENELRRIYIGERQLPPERRIPSRAGYSQGHWEDDVLVVTTTDLLDGRDQAAHPHSDEATIEERFSLETNDDGVEIMSYEATITDPIYYTEPVTISRRYERSNDTFMLPYRCPDEFWYELLELRTQQYRAGEPVDARMSDVYEEREAKE
jgi:hypothetical protein